MWGMNVKWNKDDSVNDNYCNEKDDFQVWSILNENLSFFRSHRFVCNFIS
jgi:hypothetical protein